MYAISLTKTTKNTPAARETRPRGFTVIELLVACTIIALLLAITVPAIQSAREAARRIDCRNRLRQIGIGLTSYHELNRRLPANSNAPWTIAVAPNLELTALYDGYDHNFEPWVSSRNLMLGTQAVPAWICPSAMARAWGPHQWITGSYALNAEVVGLSFNRVTDGLSNTALALETNPGFEVGWIAGPNLVVAQPDSAHGRLCHVLFGDQHVICMSRNIDSNVLLHISTPAGGETITLGD